MNTQQVEDILSTLETHSLRELDVLVAKFFYELEVKIERSDSEKRSCIRYLCLSTKKKQRLRSYSKVKSKLEKSNPRYIPLPRYSVDIRDGYELLLDASRRFGQIQIKTLDNKRVSVVMLGNTVEGTLPAAITKNVLVKLILDAEQEAQSFREDEEV